MWVKYSPYLFMGILVLVYILFPIYVFLDSFLWLFYTKTAYLQTYNVYLMSISMNKLIEFYHAVWKTAVFEARYYMQVKGDSDAYDIEGVRELLREQMIGNIKLTTNDSCMKIGCLKTML